MSPNKRTVAVISLVAAALVWLPVVHFLFRPATAYFYAERGIAPKAQEMAARHLALWTDPQGREAELGWREATTMLTGTIPPKASAAATMLKALLYMGSYFGAVVLAPILIIGAGLQWFWDQFVGGRQLPQ